MAVPGAGGIPGVGGSGVVAAMCCFRRCHIHAPISAVSSTAAPAMTGTDGALNVTADVAGRSETVIGALIFSNAPPPRSA
jgi:hypothetical protein